MKYIIEIEDEPFERGSKSLYKTNGFNSLVFDAEGLRRLKPYDESEAERQGAEKAWGIARKIMLSVGDGGMTVSEIEECFDCDDIAKLSYQEVAEKYEAWTNRRDEIRVGDEI